MEFLNIWERIKKETPLKSLNDLAALIGTSQPNISRQKKEGSFPPGWAYAVGKKYGLLTEWIMTGEGAKKPNQGSEPTGEIFKGSLAEWLNERCKKDPDFYGEFMADCAAAFPEYADWLKKRKGNLAEGGMAQQKIA